MSTALLIELLPLWLALAGALIAAVRWGLRLSRTLDQVRDVLIPADGPSMRATVAGHTLQLVGHEGRLFALEKGINPDAIPLIR